MISINKQLINVFSDLIPIGETLQYVQTKENVSTRQVSMSMIAVSSFEYYEKDSPIQMLKKYNFIEK